MFSHLIMPFSTEQRLDGAVAHITNYSEPSARDALGVQIQCLILSLLSTSKSQLSTEDVVEFVVSILDGLPSSSSNPTSTHTSQTRAAFDTSLIDMIWTVDSGLEDGLPSGGYKFETSAPLKEAYERDRRKLGAFVHLLVVCGTSLLIWLTFCSCLT